MEKSKKNVNGLWTKKKCQKLKRLCVHGELISFSFLLSIITSHTLISPRVSSIRMRLYTQMS